MTTNADIGARLKKERDRLGFSQAAFADKVDVGRTSQVNYESGERLPDAAYLAAAAQLGVDVCYVVTGLEGAGVVSEAIPKRKRAMLDLYDDLDDDVREAVDTLVRVITRKAAGSTATRALIGSQVFHGAVGQVVENTSQSGFKIVVKGNPKKD